MHTLPVALLLHRLQVVGEPLVHVVLVCQIRGKELDGVVRHVAGGDADIHRRLNLVACGTWVTVAALNQPAAPVRTHILIPAVRSCFIVMSTLSCSLQAACECSDPHALSMLVFNARGAEQVDVCFPVRRLLLNALDAKLGGAARRLQLLKERREDLLRQVALANH